MSGPIAGLTGREDFVVAIVLGSGLSHLARSLVGGDPIPYSSIETMPATSVEGHEGALYHGVIDSVPTLVFAGRVHLYEGHSALAVTRPIALAAEAACRVVVLTNAAGAVNPSLDVGEPCLISDHLNLTGTNPLIGVRDFHDMTDLYDSKLRALAKSVDPGLKEAVYAGLVGPTYETPAEVRMLATLGAELVGMSTVLEAIAARYLGMRILGISIVSNLAAGLTDRPLDHAEVTAAASKATPRLERLLRGVVPKL